MLVTFSEVLFFIFGWLTLFPEDGLALAAKLKRLLRERAIRQAIRIGERELAQALHDRAVQIAIDPKLVDQVLAEQHETIVERLGNCMADRILVDPEIPDP